MDFMVQISCTGLPLSGRKDDLVERVTENLREQFAKCSKVKKEEEVGVNV